MDQKIVVSKTEREELVELSSETPKAPEDLVLDWSEEEVLAAHQTPKSKSFLSRSSLEALHVTKLDGRMLTPAYICLHMHTRAY